MVMVVVVIAMVMVVVVVVMVIVGIIIMVMIVVVVLVMVVVIIMVMVVVVWQVVVILLLVFLFLLLVFLALLLLLLLPLLVFPLVFFLLRALLLLAVLNEVFVGAQEKLLQEVLLCQHVLTTPSSGAHGAVVQSGTGSDDAGAHMPLILLQSGVDISTVEEVSIAVGAPACSQVHRHSDLPLTSVFWSIPLG